MRSYLLKRLLLFVPTALGVSVIIFVMLHNIPGDYATALMLGNPENQIQATPEDFERIRKQLGLDGSLPSSMCVGWQISSKVTSEFPGPTEIRCCNAWLPESS